MWVEVNEVSEFMKGLLPLYLIVILPIFIIITPAECAHEFSVYRMQQFDLHGNQYGSRNALVSLEARTVDATSFTRKCVVANWNEINEQLWSELHQQNAGSVLILIPQNVTGEKMTEFLAMEEFLLKDETPLAIYFAYDTPEIQDIYLSVRASTQGKAESSALTALLSAIYASGYQMQVTASNSKALTDPQIVSVMGKLPGYGIEDQLPTIAVVAHYDAFGVAPELSFGADSNGSGVAMLIEILRLLSHLSSSSKEQPRANIMFLLAGGGKLNFQGSKRWLEDQLEGLEAGSLQDSDFTICLDTVGAGDELFMHVSKPPKEGSPGHVFYEHLKSIAADLYPEMEISQVHKKINLNTDFLAWEHERFSIRRLPAFTLSHLDNARSPWRKTILDTLEGPVGLDMKKLARNTRVVAEALARYLFKTQGAEYVFVGDRKVEEESLQAWLNLLAKSPRSPQLVAGTTKAQPPLVSTLEDTVARYASEVRLITSKPDKRDPEFVLYDVTKSTMTAYSVKPALFDLFLSMGIGAYLCGVYLVIKNFHMVYNAMEAISFSSSKAKTS